MSESHSHPPTPQEESEAKLLAYVEGELDEAGRAEIERHLETNPNHRRLLDELKAGRDLLRWVPRETAPAELMESFQSQLERAVLLEEEDEDATEEAASLRINPWYQFRAVAAVLLLAVMLGIVVFFSLPKPQNRDMAVNQRGPTTGETFTDGDAPAGPPFAGSPIETDGSRAGVGAGGGLESVHPDAADRRLAKGAPGEWNGGAKPADKAPGPDLADRTHRSKVAAGEAVLPTVPEPMPDKPADPAPLASVQGQLEELERMNFVTMSNAVRNVASVEAVQVAIDRNTVARSRAAKISKGGAEADAYTEPLYVVVNTTDPAKAREEIHSYLGANGIRNVEVLDQTVAALQSPDRVAGNYGPDAGRSMADLEARIREEKVRAKADMGAVRSPEQQKREQYGQVREQPGTAQGPAGGAGAAVAQKDAMAQRNAPVRGSPAAGVAGEPSRPNDQAKAPAGQGYSNEGNLPKRQDSPLAATPPPALPEQSLQQQAEQQQLSQQQLSQQQVVLAEDAQRIEGVLVARGMNRKQALAMQQNFNNPKQAQWVGVYETPVELRRDARGGERNQQAGVRGGRTYDPAFSAPAPAAPSVAPPAEPRAAAPALPPPAPAPAATPAPPAGAGAAKRSPSDSVARGGPPQPNQTLPAQPAPRTPAPPAGAMDERERAAGPRDDAGGRSRNATTRPSAPTVAAQPAAPSHRAARSPATQPVALRPAPGADSASSGQSMPPAPGGAGLRQPARPGDTGQDRKVAAEQVVTGRPTTGPSQLPAPNAAAATPPVAQADDPRLTDEDLPLDVVIVLQRAPLSGSQYAEQSNTQAQQFQAPANAAPATSPAAASRPAR